MAKPELDIITQIIAYSHAYRKHVLGDEPSRKIELQGVNEFRDINGRDLNIESKSDLKNYLDDFFKKEGTKGFAHPDGREFYFYNKTDNVLAVINVKDPDLGTVYRPDEKAKKWTKIYRDASKSGKVHVFDTPEAIENLTNKATKAIALSENGRVTYATRPEEIAKAEQLEKEKGSPDDSLKSNKATTLIDEAVDKADEAAKATKAGNAAKLGKLGLVTSVGMTVIAAGFIDQAHSAKRESAELFLKSGTIKQDTFDAYITLNKKVEKIMHKENIAGQGWAFIATTPIVEAKAASMFTKFSQTYNLTPKVHKALEYVRWQVNHRSVFRRCI